MRTQMRTALDALRWALAFHARHILIVTALMAIPAVQRFIIMSWDLPAALDVTTELVVLAARFALVYYVISKIGPAPHAWASTRAFLRQRWPSILITVGLLALAFGFFDVVLERIVPLALTGGAEPTYLSVLFAVKNLTVIPLTTIWMVSVVRQAVQYPLNAAVATHR